MTDRGQGAEKEKINILYLLTDRKDGSLLSHKKKIIRNYKRAPAPYPVSEENMTPDGHYIFAVDFDNTLIKGNTWPDVNGEMNIPMINYLLMEKQRGTKIILWTSRAGQPLQDAIDLCKSYGLEFDAVNENLPEIIKAYGNDSRKISADKYIDDRAVDPGGVAWTLFTDFKLSIAKSLVQNE